VRSGARLAAKETGCRQRSKRLACASKHSFASGLAIFLTVLHCSSAASKRYRGPETAFYMPKAQYGAPHPAAYSRSGQHQYRCGYLFSSNCMNGEPGFLNGSGGPNCPLIVETISGDNPYRARGRRNSQTTTIRAVTATAPIGPHGECGL